MSLLRKGASHGYAPRNFVCCICNSLLAKNSDSNVKVFSCGHAMHIHCEPEENEDSFRGTFAGCPICNSRKKATPWSTGKSVFGDNGLVSKFLIRTQEACGTQTLHPHDQHDIFENSFFSHTASTLIYELMESKSGKKRSTGKFYEAPLGYNIEDVRPNGGIKKFRSVAYSNCARKPS